MRGEASSIAPDPRVEPMHEELRKVEGSDFEAVERPREGPSPFSKAFISGPRSVYSAPSLQAKESSWTTRL